MINFKKECIDYVENLEKENEELKKKLGKNDALIDTKEHIEKNKYHIVFYFADSKNVEIYEQSNCELGEYINVFNRNFQNKECNFVNFVARKPYLMINKNNILFYTIEKESD